MTVKYFNYHVFMCFGRMFSITHATAITTIQPITLYHKKLMLLKQNTAITVACETIIPSITGLAVTR